MCSAGTYSASPGFDECKACPNNMVSLPGATSATACGCLPGHGGSNCQTCAAGTYSEGYLQTDCLSCASALPNTTSAAGATNVGQCVCQPGFYGPDCNPCPAGSFCPGGSSPSAALSAVAVAVAGDGASIVACGPGKTSPPRSSSADACVCEPGYGGEDCSVCPAGTYSSGGSTKECVPCGPNQTGPVAASSNATCYCQPGRGGDSCLSCPANTYSAGGSKAACASCPANSGSPSGSSDASECGESVWS
jgi:hypothetical protein